MISKLANLEKYRTLVVRILTGSFGFYFFYFYFQLLDTILLVRNGEHGGLLRFLTLLDQASLRIVLQCSLLLSMLACVLLIANRLIRPSALLIWFSYTFFYNFIICINQPHITYFLFVIITFVFFSSAEIENRITSIKFFNFPLLDTPLFVYLFQMTISGLSKLLLAEWRSGDILSIMSRIRDPDPGILLLGHLPDVLLKILTWSVLIIECGSVLYFFVPKLRLPIWISHVLMFIGILVFVSHATHVAFTMLIFIIFVFDSKIISSWWSSDDLQKSN